ncbi:MULTISPECIES: glycosyltransferase [Bacillaceae]|uniref:Glycosyl transferase n=1 Tax=Gottfriedia luciferensis TaxID=178774 RepID=A0ABX2ZRF9_9BACI|nr:MULTISPECIES: glycosyltransferase [Bacillaceae]ODG92002.1 glycosyl transferase [Gottfriedia luciferensis]
MKKKVLFMLSSMNIGGVEKSLLSLLSVIPKDKYDITLLLLEKKGGFFGNIPDWVNVVEATWFTTIKDIILQPPHKTLKDYFHNKQYVKMLSFLSKYLISKKTSDRNIYYHHIFKDVPKDLTLYDVAIAYQGPTDIIDYYIANRVTAKKKVSWVHFDVSKHLINTKLYKKLHKKFDKIFVVSEEAKKRLIEKLPQDVNKTEVFKNILSSSVINNMSLAEVDFDNSFIGIKILTVGRLSMEKGQDMAIKVLSKLIENGYNVRWYCIGEGEDRKEYEALIHKLGLESNFILLGAKQNPYPYVANADLYVQTSRHEGFCLTLAEARCLHKPIVTTNFTGANEQITDNYDGLIVKFDQDELFEKITYLINNPGKSEDLSRNLLNEIVDTTSEIDKLYQYIG